MHIIKDILYVIAGLFGLFFLRFLWMVGVIYFRGDKWSI